MDVTLDQLKNTMIAQTLRSDIIANNLANANTSGYKRDVVFLEVLEGVNDTEVKVETDYSQGQLNKTENPLDVAISGRGFFTVETETGEAYTRNGHFMAGSDGILRTSNGDPVLGRGGWINISNDGLKVAEVSISSKGEISLDGDLIDAFEITDITDYSNLRKVGANLYMAPDELTPEIIFEPTVLQGNLEGSNVSSIHEMINLIEVQRQFESAQRVMRNVDSALGRAVNNISRVP